MQDTTSFLSTLQAALPTITTGLTLSLSLIVAIGAQNAYVLRQGLRREHVLAVVMVCALLDMALMTRGQRAGGNAGPTPARPERPSPGRRRGGSLVRRHGLAPSLGTARTASAVTRRTPEPAHHGVAQALGFAL